MLSSLRLFLVLTTIHLCVVQASAESYDRVKTLQIAQKISQEILANWDRNTQMISAYEREYEASVQRYIANVGPEPNPTPPPHIQMAIKENKIYETGDINCEYLNAIVDPVVNDITSSCAFTDVQGICADVSNKTSSTLKKFSVGMGKFTGATCEASELQAQVTDCGLLVTMKNTHNQWMDELAALVESNNKCPATFEQGPHNPRCEQTYKRFFSVFDNPEQIVRNCSPHSVKAKLRDFADQMERSAKQINAAHQGYIKTRKNEIRMGEMLKSLFESIKSMEAQVESIVPSV